MKIYFVGSIRGKKRYLKNYEAIIKTLEKLGHKVKDNTINLDPAYVNEPSDKEKVKFYRKVLSAISWADIVLAEGSFPSMGVGYEISLALEKGKLVLVLHEEDNAPYFLEGVGSDKLEVTKYNLGNLKEILVESIDYLSGQQDVRFNFFVSPKIVRYLDFISKIKKLPRAVYLRNLIEKDMEKDKEYLKEI